MRENVMKTPDVIKAIAKELDTTQKTATIIYHGLQNVIHDTLTEKMMGFPLGRQVGSIVVNVTPEKRYVTPTGEAGYTPAHYKARLKPSEGLKKELKEKPVPEVIE